MGYGYPRFPLLPVGILFIMGTPFVLCLLKAYLPQISRYWDFFLFGEEVVNRQYKSFGCTQDPAVTV